MLGCKRVDTLIKAFSGPLSERPNSILTLIGEGPMHARLVCLAKNLINDESYRFLPPKPVAEILQIIRQDHTFVLPSNAVEGWGPVVNEAMGEGCTVIASEASGAAKSMICHRVNGYLFTPGIRIN